MSAGASPQTPLRELTALSRSPSWFQRGVSRQEGNEGEGRKGLGRGGEGKGRERGIGKGKRVKLRGNSAMVVGGIDAPAKTETLKIGSREIL